jgi:hypothetical protein
LLFRFRFADSEAFGQPIAAAAAADSPLRFITPAERFRHTMPPATLIQRQLFAELLRRCFSPLTLSCYYFDAAFAFAISMHIFLHHFRFSSPPPPPDTIFFIDISMPPLLD